MVVRGTDVLNACGQDVQSYYQLYNDYQKQFTERPYTNPEEENRLTENANAAFSRLRVEEDTILNNRNQDINNLKGRLKEIQTNDTGPRKVGRFLQAAGWGAVAAIGIVTLLPLMVYNLFVVAGDADNAINTWKRRFSLKSKEELDVRENWKNMRDRWLAEDRILNTPWESGFNLQPAKQLPEGGTLLYPKVTIIPLNQPDLLNKVSQINTIFSKSIDENAAVRPSMQ